MVARWLQQKFNKQRKMRRAYLQQKAGSGQVNVPKILAHDIFQNKNRSRSTVGNNGSTLPKLDNTFLEEIPETFWYKYWDNTTPLHEQDEEEALEYVKFVSTYLYTKPKARPSEVWLAWCSNPKRVVNDRKHAEIVENYKRLHRSFLLDTLYEVWQGKYAQGVRDYHEVKLRTGEDYSLCMYFAGNEFLFVQTYKDQRWISRTYQDRMSAMARYHRTFEDEGSGLGIEWIIRESVNKQ